jgi:hypothetical protein
MFILISEAAGGAQKAPQKMRLVFSQLPAATNMFVFYLQDASPPLLSIASDEKAHT